LCTCATTSRHPRSTACAPAARQPRITAAPPAARRPAPPAAWQPRSMAAPAASTPTLLGKMAMEPAAMRSLKKPLNVLR